MHSHLNTERDSNPWSETLSVLEQRAALPGGAITADRPDYEGSRQVLNAAIDPHPALIVRAADAGDVAAVSLAHDARKEES